MNSFSISLRKGVTIMLCLSAIVIESCQKEGPVNPSLTTTTDDSTLKYILSLGYSKDRIVDKGKFYLVEGDIMFWKNKNNRGARPAQKARISSPLARLSSVGNVSVQVVPSSFPNSAWFQRIVDGTQAAISSWNTISSNCKIDFYYVAAPANADIYIDYNPNLGLDNYGSTELPQSCTPQTTIYLNNQAQYLSVDQLHFLIAHELGHTVGFTHTDGRANGQDDNGVLSFIVQNTPSSDAGSIMNSGSFFGVNSNPSSVKKWSDFPGGFSTFDRTAASVLFPNTANISATYSQDFSGYPVKLTWTPSNFCSSTVNIEVYDGNNRVYRDLNVPNNGLKTYTTSSITSGTTYEFIITDPNAPTDSPLSTQTSFTF